MMWAWAAHTEPRGPISRVTQKLACPNTRLELNGGSTIIRPYSASKKRESNQSLSVLFDPLVATVHSPSRLRLIRSFAIRIQYPTFLSLNLLFDRLLSGGINISSIYWTVNKNPCFSIHSPRPGPKYTCTMCVCSYCSIEHVSPCQRTLTRKFSIMSRGLVTLADTILRCAVNVLRRCVFLSAWD